MNNSILTNFCGNTRIFIILKPKPQAQIFISANSYYNDKYIMYIVIYNYNTYNTIIINNYNYDYLQS